MDKDEIKLKLFEEIQRMSVDSKLKAELADDQQEENKDNNK